MDAIERAIRNALEKGNAEDRTFREKVYRQAFAALDRAMQAHPNMTVEVAIGRRKNLQSKIAEIETEFLPAVPVRTPHPALKPTPAPEVRRGPTPSPAPEVMRGPTPSAAAPSVAPEVRPAGQAASQAPRRTAPPIALDGAADSPASVSPPVRVSSEREGIVSVDPGMRIDEVAPDRDVVRASRRSFPFAFAFVVVTIVAALAIGGWWVTRTGLFRAPAEFGGTVPPDNSEEDFTPPAGGNNAAPPRPGDADASRNWIPVFSPADLSLVSAPSGTTAEVRQDDSGSYLRIRSGASGAAIVFDVGQGILQQIAGHKAVFDIIARAEDGKETQISVQCDFGELGDCGRKRYAVGYARAEYLFDVDLPANNPGASGSIAISSDITTGENAVDIYEIRVSVAE